MFRGDAQHARTGISGTGTDDGVIRTTQVPEIPDKMDSGTYLTVPVEVDGTYQRAGLETQQPRRPRHPLATTRGVCVRTGRYACTHSTPATSGTSAPAAPRSAHNPGAASSGHVRAHDTGTRPRLGPATSGMSGPAARDPAHGSGIPGSPPTHSPPRPVHSPGTATSRHLRARGTATPQLRDPATPRPRNSATPRPRDAARHRHVRERRGHGPARQIGRIRHTAPRPAHNPKHRELEARPGTRHRDQHAAQHPGLALPAPGPAHRPGTPDWTLPAHSRPGPVHNPKHRELEARPGTRHRDQHAAQHPGLALPAPGPAHRPGTPDWTLPAHSRPGPVHNPKHRELEARPGTRHRDQHAAQHPGLALPAPGPAHRPGTPDWTLPAHSRPGPVHNPKHRELEARPGTRHRDQHAAQHPGLALPAPGPAHRPGTPDWTLPAHSAQGPSTTRSTASSRHVRARDTGTSMRPSTPGLRSRHGTRPWSGTTGRLHPEYVAGTPHTARASRIGHARVRGTQTRPQPGHRASRHVWALGTHAAPRTARPAGA